MFIYFVNYFNWSDSVYCPVFHEDEYDKNEFEKICKDVALKVIDNINQHNEDMNLSGKSISKYELLEGMVELLCSDYGFEKKSILMYDVDTEIVDAHEKF